MAGLYVEYTEECICCVEIVVFGDESQGFVVMDLDLLMLCQQLG